MREAPPPRLIRGQNPLFSGPVSCHGFLAESQHPEHEQRGRGGVMNTDCEPAGLRQDIKKTSQEPLSIITTE